MEKRQCTRFTVPGSTLFYKKQDTLFKKASYSDAYYPVLDISKGGTRFLSNERLKIGACIDIRLSIPGKEIQAEIKGTIRWVSINREESYRYQTGVAFEPFGSRKNENPADVLAFIDSIEAAHSASNKPMNAPTANCFLPTEP